MNAVTDALNPYDNLLSRLEGVQSTGKGQRSRCPACGGKSRKLSLAQGNDGRVLLHCFGGCSAADVLAAVGLTVADLFDRPITSKMTPAERHELRECQRQSQWRAALEVLYLESTVILIAIRQLCDDVGITEDDYQRMKLAVERVANAREVLSAKT